MVHHGWAAPSVLDSYGIERSGHVRVIIDEAVALGRIICELDPERATERDTRMKDQARNPESATREPPHPRLGQPSLTIASGDADGRLAPQGRVRVADQVALFDDVFGSGWQLVSRVGDPVVTLGNDEVSWFLQIGGTIADMSDTGHVVDVDGRYERWFSEHNCDVFLARPDFYVFAAGRHEDIPRFISCLRRTLQPNTAIERND
jgi:hypothetical protein